MIISLRISSAEVQSSF